MRCAAITKAGERCRLVATHGSYCRQHTPEMADARKRAASRGGRAGGRGRPGVGAGELETIRGQLARLYDDVLSEKVDTGTATVAVQVQHARLRGVEISRKVKELDEMEERFASLEERLNRAG